MSRKFLNVALTCCIFSIPAALSAQESSRLSFNAQGGFSQTAGNTSRQLNTGWNLGVGAGVNFVPAVGALVQFDFNDFGINSTTLNNLGYPGGNVHVWDFTLDPIVHLHPHGHVDAYLIGGGGVYHVLQQFTAPTIATVTGFNPFFGFYQAGVPASQVLSSYSVNKPGVNGGAGIEFGTKWRGKFYAEARYHRVIFSNHHIDMIPVSFGYRW
jgi:hypothetical protein